MTRTFSFTETSIKACAISHYMALFHRIHSYLVIHSLLLAGFDSLASSNTFPAFKDLRFNYINYTLRQAGRALCLSQNTFLSGHSFFAPGWFGFFGIIEYFSGFQGFEVQLHQLYTQASSKSTLSLLSRFSSGMVSSLVTGD